MRVGATHIEFIAAMPKDTYNASEWNLVRSCIIYDCVTFFCKEKYLFNIYGQISYINPPVKLVMSIQHSALLSFHLKLNCFFHLFE